MSRFDLVIFDCDGTLVDSEYLNNKATAEILAAYGLPQYDLDYCLRHYVGVSMTDMADRIFHETGVRLPAGFLDDYTAAVQRLMPTDLRGVEGVAGVLDALPDGTAICVASNGERPNVLKSIRIAGLASYFPDDAVFTANMVERPKPAPDLFLYVAQRMNVKPERIAVIEDSPSGVRAGVAARMTVFGFTGTYLNPEAQADILRQAGAQICVKAFADLAALLNRAIPAASPQPQDPTP